MSDLFWIIPSIILGGSAGWFIGVGIVELFIRFDLRDIAFGAWLLAIVASILSIGWWLANQSSSPNLQFIGSILLILVGLVAVVTFFGLND